MNYLKQIYASQQQGRLKDSLAKGFPPFIATENNSRAGVANDKMMYFDSAKPGSQRGGSQESIDSILGEEYKFNQKNEFIKLNNHLNLQKQIESFEGEQHVNKI